MNTETSVQIQHKLVKNLNGRLTSWLFTSMVKELKLGIAVLQIQLVVRAGIEPMISDAKSSILTTPPRCLPDIT